MARPTILTLTDYYLPGFMAGGAVRSIASMVENLGNEFAFKIITRDRDYTSKAPYPSVDRTRWNRVGKAEVYYLSPGYRGWRMLWRLLRSVPYEVLYLNSFFSPQFTSYPLLLRRLGFVFPEDVVLAPRGEFSPGAIALKGRKKALFISFSRAVRLHRQLRWHASTEIEAEHIREILGELVKIEVALDISEPADVNLMHSPSAPKEPGSLKIIFLSRIAEKKNLDGAINMLRDVGEGEITFNIYGPIDDAAYWASCQAGIASLPPNVITRYHGAIGHEKVRQVMAQNHVFLLPTRGENFGHVVREALEAGCVTIISDQTPWTALEDWGVGWALPLERPEAFSRALRHCLRMGDAEFKRRAKRARTVASSKDRRVEAVEATRQLFA